MLSQSALGSTTQSDDLGAAGGVLGLGVGGALHAAAAVTGSLLILGLLGIFGLIVLTGSSAGALGPGFCHDRPSASELVEGAGTGVVQRPVQNRIN